MDSYNNDNSDVRQDDGGENLIPENDNIEDDYREDAHPRRGSYQKDDREYSPDREYNDDSDSRHRRDPHDRDVRDRSSSLDRGRNSYAARDSSQTREQYYDKDDKYDDDRRDRPAGSRTRSRSKSRSPMRNTGSNLRERRVYIGNLSYDVKWTDLKDFMRDIGPVAHADVLLDSAGRSKGWGIVEFQSASDAREAIRRLNNVVLMGRAVLVREDRETEGRIGCSGIKRDREREPNTRQIYVANLPYSVNWKDLKDLFKRAGHVDRADIFMSSDMRSKGSGTVQFERSSDVQRADKHGPSAGVPARGSSRYDPPPPPRNSSHRGDDYGRGRSYGYGDYRQESSSSRSRHTDYYEGSSRSSRHGHYSHSYHDMSMASVPSGPAAGSGDQIYIRNILLHSGRPRGSGIVRFELFEAADKAVAKFNGYIYGGRPLEIVYDRV
ncbi:hypothetical protein BG011_006700 [Mortierella polycephala]|uniref:RRM domain-containing protein n=1 Tax=Mortierella polycephala TaxID=41804 RepID=A0A9P6PUK5_9FUNG|nr:hypothetical protein BG011_006700 [Mortierella polycephala]